MKFNVITIFPKAFSYLDESILKKAQEKGLIEVGVHNLRDFSEDRHGKVDDKSYGGGPGMVLKIEPIIKAIEFLTKKSRKLKAKTLIILFTPAGKQFDSKTAINLAGKYERLIFICGHYEGIDARVKKAISGLGLKVEEISVGPYVLGGGELPAMVVIDAVSRHLPGVLGKGESLEEKRLGVGVPVYTRPEVFAFKKKKYSVPKVLLSGNHAVIEQWRIKNKKA